MKTRWKLLLIASIIPIAALSRNPEKEYRKMIEKYDVTSVTDTLSSHNPADFWKAVRENNKIYQKALKDAKKGKAKAAQRAIGEAVEKMRSYNDMIPTVSALNALADSLVDITGAKDLHRESRLAFTYSLGENAYSYPGGDVYLTLGLFNRLNEDTDLITAAYVHELAHFVLQHAFTLAYQEEKDLKRARLIHNIVSAIDIGLSSYGDAVNESRGIYTNNADIAEINAQLKDMELNNSVVTYRFDYGHDQIYEADIIAYRFLQWMGLKPDTYIRMLRAIDSDLEIFQNSEDDRPLTADRIALLQYLDSGEYDKWRKEQIIKKKQEERERRRYPYGTI